MEVSLTLGVFSLVLGAVVTWVLYHLVHFYMQYRALRKAALQFPSKERHWFWGTIHHVRAGGIDDAINRSLEMARVNNRVFASWRTSLQPVLSLVHSDTIKHVMKTAEPKATRMMAGYTFLKPWLGDGLLISSGAKWERNRKLLTSAFHFNVLKPYVTIYNEAADVLLGKLERLSKRGESIEVFNHMALYTLDVMLQCAFSYKDNIQDAGEIHHPYVTAVRRLARLVPERHLRPHLYVDFFFSLSKLGKENKKLLDYVHSFCEKLISERKEMLGQNPDAPKKSHLDFLDILLTAKDEKGVGLSMEDIRAEADTFLFEGHDTTASATSWTLYALAKYPDMQDKVRQEVDELLGDREYLEWNDLPNLKYTSIFLKEVLRMYPPVPSVSRQTTKPCVIDGVTIPPGMIIHLAIMLVHHNADVWENPEEFRPERFLSETFLTRNPYCYVPFSAGPRNCIGQNFAFNEEKVVISRIVKRFKIILDESHPVSLVPELVLRAKDGIKLKFIPRSS
ncbi:cytochrome P450 4F2-like [Liolophura sinensis]|uniref:cytochrome P450 4F2-like n=1 Tax=Liolophura sinensis TaxID=3198878 RepID=UPI0031596EBF